MKIGWFNICDEECGLAQFSLKSKGGKEFLQIDDSIEYEGKKYYFSIVFYDFTDEDEALINKDYNSDNSVLKAYVIKNIKLKLLYNELKPHFNLYKDESDTIWGQVGENCTHVLKNKHMDEIEKYVDNVAKFKIKGDVREIKNGFIVENPARMFGGDIDDKAVYMYERSDEENVRYSI